MKNFYNLTTNFNGFITPKIHCELTNVTSDRQYFASKVFIKFLSKIFYRFTISGTEYLKDLKAPYIIAANHHSTIDAIIMGLFIPPPYRIHNFICNFS